MEIINNELFINNLFYRVNEMGQWDIITTIRIFFIFQNVYIWQVASSHYIDH